MPWAKKFCIFLNNLLNNFTVRFYVDDVAEACDCPLPCTDVEYRVTLTSSTFPTKTFASVLWENETMPPIFENFR